MNLGKVEQIVFTVLNDVLRQVQLLQRKQDQLGFERAQEEIVAHAQFHVDDVLFVLEKLNQRILFWGFNFEIRHIASALEQFKHLGIVGVQVQRSQFLQIVWAWQVLTVGVDAVLRPLG